MVRRSDQFFGHTADALPHEAGGGAPWPAKCETQGKTSPSDNYFDKYRLGYGSCTVGA